MEYFCRIPPPHPEGTISTGPPFVLDVDDATKKGCREGGEERVGWREGGKGFGSVWAVCMSPAVFSGVFCYFVVFLFILQSKEYPRNVPGNPTRKCVEKEVCKKHWVKESEREKGERDRATDGSIYPSSPINHGITELIGMNVGPTTWLSECVCVSVRER